MSDSQNTNAPGLKVLIVDDEDFITTVIQKIASRLGCEVSSVNDARKVGSAVVAFNPDVIFLDLLMPEVDGVEVINMLCEAKSDAKLILMSGLDERTIKSVSEIAVNGGLDVIGTLSKPVQADKIEQLLSPLFKSQSTENASSVSPSAETQNTTGFQLQLHAEKNLKEGTSNSVPWYTADVMWVLDSGESVEFESVLDKSSLSAMQQGIVNLIFQQLPVAMSKAGLDHRNCGIRIPLSGTVLSDKGAPELISAAAKAAGISPQGIAIEMSEAIAASQSESLLNSVSRLKIKGFKLSACVHANLETVLSGLMKMPIDELVLDMEKANLQGTRLDDSETDFQIGSLVSFATKRSMTTSASRVSDARQLAFVERCNFDKASGPAVKAS